MKRYTIKQASELKGVNHRALAKQLERDAKKDKKLRKYPHAYKAECCGAWLIPARDINNIKSTEDE